MNFKKITAALSAAVLSLSSVAALSSNAASNTGSNCATRILGDADNDGVVNACDATYVYRFLNGAKDAKLVNPAQADFNFDGVITKKDGDLILQDYANHAAKGFLLGDIDENGVINIVDVVRLNRYLSDETKKFSIATGCADINRNGQIDRDDSDMLIWYITTYKWGDVDLDGVVDACDASAVLAYIAGKNSFPINYVYADVNKDGFVTKADAQIILNAYAHHTILK